VQKFLHSRDGTMRTSPGSIEKSSENTIHEPKNRSLETEDVINTSAFINSSSTRTLFSTLSPCSTIFLLWLCYSTFDVFSSQQRPFPHYASKPTRSAIYPSPSISPSTSLSPDLTRYHSIDSLYHRSCNERRRNDNRDSSY